LYLEEHCKDFATVSARFLIHNRIDQVPGWYSLVGDTLVVADNPYKHIREGMLWLEQELPFQYKMYVRFVKTSNYIP
jgi:hypothetical protein